jgi:hypothetical protein
MFKVNRPGGTCRRGSFAKPDIVRRPVLPALLILSGLFLLSACKNPFFADKRFEVERLEIDWTNVNVLKMLYQKGQPFDRGTFAANIPVEGYFYDGHHEDVRDRVKIGYNPDELGLQYPEITLDDAEGWFFPQPVGVYDPDSGIEGPVHPLGDPFDGLVNYTFAGYDVTTGQLTSSGGSSGTMAAVTDEIVICVVSYNGKEYAIAIIP